MAAAWHNAAERFTRYTLQWTAAPVLLPKPRWRQPGSVCEAVQSLLCRASALTQSKRTRLTDLSCRSGKVHPSAEPSPAQPPPAPRSILDSLLSDTAGSPSEATLNTSGEPVLTAV